jgi:hypothetical protein
MPREITEEDKAFTLNRSTDRAVAKHFPEYLRFCTGKVEWRKHRIVNVADQPEIDALDEVMEGGLGDIVETYVNLMLEKRDAGTFMGGLRNFFNFKRQSYDRDYILGKLKTALNDNFTLRW